MHPKNARNAPMVGFWQVLASEQHEDTLPFRGTTTTERAGSGFTLYTQGYYMDVRILSMRKPPAGHPPSEDELTRMFQSIRAAAGRCAWTTTGDGWVVEHTPIAQSHPPSYVRSRSMTPDGAGVVATGADGETERWRRLSGPGSSPLSGVWESGEPPDRWLYMATDGHYGLLHTDLTVPPSPLSFSINMGARLETAGGFDHCPMLSQVYGYDVRKHESFKLEGVEQDRFFASIPTFPFPAAEWARSE